MRSGLGTRAASYCTSSPRSMATRVYVGVDQWRMADTVARPLRVCAGTCALASWTARPAGAAACDALTLLVPCATSPGLVPGCGTLLFCEAAWLASACDSGDTVDPGTP